MYSVQHPIKVRHPVKMAMLIKRCKIIIHSGRRGRQELIGDRSSWQNYKTVVRVWCIFQSHVEYEKSKNIKQNFLEMKCFWCSLPLIQNLGRRGMGLLYIAHIILLYIQEICGQRGLYKSPFQNKITKRNCLLTETTTIIVGRFRNK